MVAHQGPRSAALGIKNNETGLLPGHVAINAILGDFISQLREPAAACRLMAAQAALRERRVVPLRRVHVMARRARHRRRLETAAFFQEFDLAPMNIHLGLRGWQIDVLVQRLWRQERKRWKYGLTSTKKNRRAPVWAARLMEG
jgi:hypothetical protein